MVPLELPAKLAYFLVPLPTALRTEDGFTFQFFGPELPSLEEFRDLHDRGLHAHDVQYVPELIASLRFWQLQESPPRDLGVLLQLLKLFNRAVPTTRKTRRRAKRRVPKKIAARMTVVEMGVPIPERDPIELEISDAFDRGLEAIQQFQRAYAVAAGEPVQVATREGMPWMVPFGVRLVSEELDQWPEGPSIFFANKNLPSVTEPAISKEQWDTLHLVLDVSGFNPFFDFAEVAREARLAFHKLGEYRMAVALAETAAELLLDGLLSMLIWEESERYPEDVARGVFPLNRPITRRVAAEFPGRLGGDWNLDGTAAPAEWVQHLARLRHRVIHGGYRPTYDETARALEALSNFEDFIKDRLLERVGKYPRTAMHLLGRPGLKRRGRWSTKLDDLTNDPSEPPWLPTFARFRWVLEDERLRRFDAELAPESSAEDLVPVFVVAADDSEEGWFLHDENRRIACRAAEPEDLTEAFASSVNEARAANQASENPVRMSFGLLDGSSHPLPGSSWARDYHLIPNVGVMLRDPKS
jgi:hypothetical protein